MTAAATAIARHSIYSRKDSSIKCPYFLLQSQLTHNGPYPPHLGSVTLAILAANLSGASMTVGRMPKCSSVVFLTQETYKTVIHKHSVKFIGRDGLHKLRRRQTHRGPGPGLSEALKDAEYRPSGALRNLSSHHPNVPDVFVPCHPTTARALKWHCIPFRPRGCAYTSRPQTRDKLDI